MRIIGGKAKGRIIQFPASSRERPTSDFLREALFNLLGPLDGKTFLDLFAGSGSVGIEAASRGAQEIILIEKDKKIAAAAQRNIDICGFDKQCRLLVSDTGTGLRGLYRKKCIFDFVFADPPYSRGLVEETIRVLKENPVMTGESIIIIQHSVREDVLVLLEEEINLQEQRKYGDSILSFLKWSVHDTGEIHQ
ncbi:MAG TPA: 16S rRNA (guanine(966)-N(2))-methyltransferase RsmD [Smithellaceae bacterium]|nr:16S rRNA (guanine(966)-N(2))-methyltransferase RsmD [Smithellaceae bacterium]